MPAATRAIPRRGAEGREIDDTRARATRPMAAASFRNTTPPAARPARAHTLACHPRGTSAPVRTGAQAGRRVPPGSRAGQPRGPRRRAPVGGRPSRGPRTAAPDPRDGALRPGRSRRERPRRPVPAERLDDEAAQLEAGQRPEDGRAPEARRAGPARRPTLVPSATWQRDRPARTLAEGRQRARRRGPQPASRPTEQPEVLEQLRDAGDDPAPRAPPRAGTRGSPRPPGRRGARGRCAGRGPAPAPRPRS